MSTPIADSFALDEQLSNPPALATGRNGNSAEEQDTEDLDYRPVPRSKSVTVAVRYHVRGRGKPLPYVMDDECDV